MPSSGIILLDKEEGVTSRYCDNAIQKKLKNRHVGHLGTLDPFATGLLIVCFNSATKFLPYLKDEEKTYVASLILGQKTSTGDKTGEIIETKPIPSLTKEDIEEALNSFLGDSLQIPPMTSAIKRDGVPLYKLAHEGKEIKREPRPIKVYSVKLLSFEANRIDFVVKVSKGTYIRTLGEDIALKLGTLGYLNELRRIAIGDITVDKAVKLDEVDESKLLPASSFLGHIPSILVSEEEAKKVKNGMTLDLKSSQDRVLVKFKEEILAIYQKKGDGHFHCQRGLWE